jgi:hypothetical protein
MSSSKTKTKTKTPFIYPDLQTNVNDLTFTSEIIHEVDQEQIFTLIGSKKNTQKYFIGVEIANFLQRQTYNLYRTLYPKCKLFRLTNEQLGFFLKNSLVNRGSRSVTLCQYEAVVPYMKTELERKLQINKLEINKPKKSRSFPESNDQMLSKRKKLSSFSQEILNSFDTQQPFLWRSVVLAPFLSTTTDVTTKSDDSHNSHNSHNSHTSHQSHKSHESHNKIQCFEPNYQPTNLYKAHIFLPTSLF